MTQEFGNISALERERFTHSLPDRKDTFPNQLEAALKDSSVGEHFIEWGSVLVVFCSFGGIHPVKFYAVTFRSHAEQTAEQHYYITYYYILHLGILYNAFAYVSTYKVQRRDGYSRTYNSYLGEKVS